MIKTRRSIIDAVFSSLEKDKITYAVLRGYQPIEALYSSPDIDLFVSQKDLKRFHGIMLEAGFRTPALNACAYPHVQYFLLTAEGLVKFDIVYDFCFGDKLLLYANKKNAISSIVSYQNIKVFPPAIALEILLLHIVFDKGKIDNHNYQRLIHLIDELPPVEPDDPAIQSVVHAASRNELSIESFNKSLETLRAGLLSSLAKSNHRALLFRTKTCFVHRLRYFLHRYRNKGIAILGVDGSGKSTTIQYLKSVLKDSCTVQYMGFREMETAFGKEWYSGPANQPFHRIKLYLGIYLEMWSRYIKNAFHPHGITVFDRFPWEAYENATGNGKLIYYFLFHVLFPSPKRVYYIHCDAATAFQRKDDLGDKDAFIVKKNNADSRYLKRKNIPAFSSDDLSTQEIAAGICNDLMATDLYDFLF